MEMYFSRREQRISTITHATIVNLHPLCTLKKPKQSKQDQNISQPTKATISTHESPGEDNPPKAKKPRISSTHHQCPEPDEKCHRTG